MRYWIWKISLIAHSSWSHEVKSRSKSFFLYPLKIVVFTSWTLVARSSWSLQKDWVSLYLLHCFSLLITRICVCTRKRSLNRFTLSLSLMSMYHIYGLKFQWLFFPFYVVIIDFKFCLILLCWLGFVSSHSFRFFCFVWFRFDCFRGFFCFDFV